MQNWKKGCVFGHFIDIFWKVLDRQIKKNACKNTYLGSIFIPEKYVIRGAFCESMDEPDTPLAIRVPPPPGFSDPGNTSDWFRWANQTLGVLFHVIWSYMQSSGKPSYICSLYWLTYSPKLSPPPWLLTSFHPITWLLAATYFAIKGFLNFKSGHFSLGCGETYCSKFLGSRNTSSDKTFWVNTNSKLIGFVLLLNLH